MASMSTFAIIWLVLLGHSYSVPAPAALPDGQVASLIGSNVTIPGPPTGGSPPAVPDSTLSEGNIASLIGSNVTVPGPPTGGAPGAPAVVTQTLAPGNTVVVVGTVTVPVPPDLTTQSVVTTLGQTVTIGPPSPIDSASPPEGSPPGSDSSSNDPPPGGSPSGGSLPDGSLPGGSPSEGDSSSSGPTESGPAGSKPSENSPTGGSPQIPPFDNNPQTPSSPGDSADNGAETGSAEPGSNTDGVPPEIPSQTQSGSGLGGILPPGSPETGNDSASALPGDNTGSIPFPTLPQTADGTTDANLGGTASSLPSPPLLGTSTTDSTPFPNLPSDNPTDSLSFPPLLGSTTSGLPSPPLLGSSTDNPTPSPPLLGNSTDVLPTPPLLGSTSDIPPPGLFPGTSTGRTGPGPVNDVLPPTTTSSDTPPFATWPPVFEVSPIPDPEQEEAETDDDETKVPCKIWFFNLCILKGDIQIKGWKLPPLPPGIYPPGPPPGIKFPPGITISGSLPPWPEITVGNDHKLTFADEPSSCEVQTANIIYTSTVQSVSVSSTAISTTASSEYTTTASIVGCNVKDLDISQTGTTTCQTSTVTNTWLSCTSSPGAMTTSCTPTSTSTVTGCDITPTTRSCTIPTSSGAAAPTDFADIVKRADPGPASPQEPECEPAPPPPIIHVVYPNDGMDDAQTTAIDARLRRDGTDVYQSKTIHMGTNFWWVTLTAPQAAQIEQDMGQLGQQIASIYQRENPTPRTVKWTGDKRSVIFDPDEYDPSTAVVYQEAAKGGTYYHDHLTYVGQQPGKEFTAYEGRYYFHDSPIPGDKVPVYIVDTGANLAHSDFERVQKKARWLHVGTDWNGKTKEEDDAATNFQDPANPLKFGKAHGSSMLGLVTGNQVGVSKNVNPVIVRLPRRNNMAFHGGWKLDDLIEGIGKVNDDAMDTKQGDFILLLAHYVERVEFLRNNVDKSAGFERRMYVLLQSIAKLGGLIVTGTGNGENIETIDGWPANFGKTLRPLDPRQLYIRELLVVGGTFPATGGVVQNKDWPAGLPHIVAPSSGFQTVDGNDPSQNRFREAGGTSCSAAITAGLGAYFLALKRKGNIKDMANGANGLRQYILDKGWQRPKTEMNGICNGAILPPPTEPNILGIKPKSGCQWEAPPIPKQRFALRQTPDDQCKIPSGLGDPLFIPDDDDTVYGAPGAGTPSQTASQTSSGTPFESFLPGVPTLQPPLQAPPEPTAGQVQCSPKSCHDDVHSDDQDELAVKFCNRELVTELKPEDTKPRGLKAEKYSYLVNWQQDCKTSATSQKVNRPIESNPDLDCHFIMRELYTSCRDNGGAGGTVINGCLNYTFSVESHAC